MMNAWVVSCEWWQSKHEEEGTLGKAEALCMWFHLKGG